MKKIILTLAALAALAGPALAQTSAVTNAILNQRSGLLDKARTDIDQAALNEKTSLKAKTWFTRGDIYEAMMDSPIYGKQLKPGEGTQKAYESYAKTIELDGKAGEYGAQAVKKIDNVYARAFNDGVNAFNAKDYDNAIASYQLAAKVRPADTTVVLYSAYAADAKQDYAGARTYYNQLLGQGYKSPAVFNRLLQMAKADKNEAETGKVLQQALAAYPNNKAFMLEDLNLYLSTGRGKEALAKLDRAIAADPTNSNLYAVKGSILDQDKRPAEAFAAYQKAVEIDPTNFDAEFNLGVYYYNKAADAYTRASKLDLKTYQVSGKGLEADGKKNFEASLPYFEKALALQPDDRNTMQSLQKVYFRLGRTADSARMQTKLAGGK